MTEKKRKNAFKDDLDGEYIGNVFGWKISIIGFVIIAAFIALYFFLSRMNQAQAVPESSEHVIQKDNPIRNDKDTISLE